MLCFTERTEHRWKSSTKCSLLPLKTIRHPIPPPSVWGNQATLWGKIRGELSKQGSSSASVTLLTRPRVVP
jgi:hypothetical protein